MVAVDVLLELGVELSFDLSLQIYDILEVPKQQDILLGGLMS